MYVSVYVSIFFECCTVCMCRRSRPLLPVSAGAPGGEVRRGVALAEQGAHRGQGRAAAARLSGHRGGQVDAAGRHPDHRALRQVRAAVSEEVPAQDLRVGGRVAARRGGGSIPGVGALQLGLRCVCGGLLAAGRAAGGRPVSAAGLQLRRQGGHPGGRLHPGAPVLHLPAAAHHGRRAHLRTERAGLADGGLPGPAGRVRRHPPRQRRPQLRHPDRQAGPTEAAGGPGALSGPAAGAGEILHGVSADQPVHGQVRLQVERGGGEGGRGRVRAAAAGPGHHVLQETLEVHRAQQVPRKPIHGKNQNRILQQR